MELGQLLGDLMGELGKIAKTSTLVGKPFRLGESWLVPLCRVSMGFGTGASDAAAGSTGRDGALEGGGAGGGLSIEPRAFVVVGPDGIPQMLSMRRGKRAVLQHAVEVLPAHPEASPPQIPAASGSGR